MSDRERSEQTEPPPQRETRDYRSLRARIARRAVTIPAVGLAAIGLTLAAPIWAPLAAIADILRLKLRLPIARLLLFAMLWAWIETAGLILAFGAWATLRAKNAELHYRLMGWWTDTLIRALRFATGLDIEVDGADALADGDAIVLCRHASLADSLVTAWAFCCRADLQPRYVLKRELLSDPCLDVVGLRVPNYFLDREAVDGTTELGEITNLARGLDARSVAVIFPEGTRASARKQERALAKIAQRDRDRADHMRQLKYLLPPRPLGTRALLEGAPDADVILVWHVGFDGLHDFRGIIRRLGRRPAPAKLVATRIPGAEVPRGEELESWLDAEWIKLDRKVTSEMEHRRQMTP